MDLQSIESKQVISLVQEWINYPEQELEATFGIGGQVDSTTFLQIAQRLRIKNFELIPQDDRLSIITPNHVRLSLQGLGVLQQYCKDDKLAGKPFTAMIKDRTSKESNVDLKEYNVRIKSRREVNLSRDDPSVREITDNWETQNKAFRLIRRWTFRSKGIRIDMSMVRSTPKDNKGQFIWVKSFLQHNIFKEQPHYEVEVELLRNEFTNTNENALKSLISGIGEVLRAIQKNTLLIRNSISESVKKEYGDLIKSERFRGVSPVTLELKNMTSEIDDDIPNIRKSYNVTDKADGLRAMGFVNKQGELFLIDMSLNVYRTGLVNKKCSNSLVDGEWVTTSKDGRAINHYLIFDIYYAKDSENVSTLPFVDITGIDTNVSRYTHMNKWFNEWKDGIEINTKSVTESNKLLVGLKQFQFATPDNSSIFTACTRILDTARIYETDGLIITSNTSPLPQKAGETFYEQFKWKPSSQNTIDFLVNLERDPSLPTIDKITTGIHPKSGETIRYKTLRLFVGSDKDPAFDNPRNTILLEQNIPRDKKGSNRYKPVLFNPLDFPDTMANTCHLPIKIDPETGEEYITTYDKNDLLMDISSEVGSNEDNKELAIQRKMLQLHSLIGTGEPIRDRSIIEMRYEPKNESGWRWIPIRVRHDKTERLIKGAKTGNYARTLNSEKVANSVWNSIHNPVTTTMIRTGSEEPAEDEIKDLLKARDTDVAKKYYERKASEEDIMLVRGMLDFHNKYIKNNLLYMKLLKGGGKSVLDIGCGKGGDLYKWIFNRARLVVGIDVAGENITNPRDGAYKRYLEAIVEFGFNRVPQIAFVIGNFSRSVITGEAGATPEERDMLRSIFGKEEPEGPVPKYIETKMAGSLRAGADMAVSMFTVHYFFENKESLDGLIKNLNDTVKVGGYFAGAAFDGQKVFNLLRGVEKGHSRIGKEGNVPIWTITKQYDNPELAADDSSIGMAIDVEFISIGTTHREYLVPFELLQLKLKEIGFELLDANESKQMGLNNSTNTFDVSYQMAEKSGKKFVMPESVKEFSFLNRWFIFKRKSERATLELPPVVTEGEEGADIEATLNGAPSVATSTVNGATAAASSTATVSSGIEETKEGEEEEGEGEGAAAAAAAAAAATGENTSYKMPSADRKFAPAEIFRFGPKVPTGNTLKIKDTTSPLWLALNAPFPIPDPDDATITYPTVEHYIAGMKLKLASNKPILAKQLMSTAGSIHQAALIKRRTKGGISLDSPYDIELRGEESNEVKKALLKKSLNSLRATFDETAWIPIKDNVLNNALSYRWENDKRFHTIVEAARNQGKYLLYSSDSPGSELGGVRSPATGRIDGENKVGITIMKIAGFKF